MQHEYDRDGDAIMRDIWLPEIANAIKKLSEDILYEIFMSLAGEPFFNNCDLAVLLSHVCRTWRSVIIRAPLLWKFVTMHSSGSSKDHSATVESFLCRSQDQPITFVLFLRKTLLLPLPVARILHRHAHRVRSLCVRASDFPCLAYYLGHMSSLYFTSLEHLEAVVRPSGGCFTLLSRGASGPDNTNIPVSAPAGLRAAPSRLDIPTLWFKYSSLGRFDAFQIVQTAQSTLQLNQLYFPCLSNMSPSTSTHREINNGPRVPAGIRTSHRGITTLLFEYSSLAPFDILLLVEMAQSTLQNLKLYFPCRSNIPPSTHREVRDGPRIDLPELRSMNLGYHEPLSLVPFLHRVRLRRLESLSIHDFRACPEVDTPPCVAFSKLQIRTLQNPMTLEELLDAVQGSHLRLARPAPPLAVPRGLRAQDPPDIVGLPWRRAPTVETREPGGPGDGHRCCARGAEDP
ncbi:hypothetical protein B0H17DRAFT_1080941 [Mycena rosella]|uniref:F-box domain-containing protein n=1 Tax=Mycena rosella TaxID=1033263 RepID=A0AAD7D2M9_MYCRO|nr:hypothetical protein B0H17DRAFT_1080941 [Mycena rosella]